MLTICWSKIIVFPIIILSYLSAIIGGGHSRNPNGCLRPVLGRLMYLSLKILFFLSLSGVLTGALQPKHTSTWCFILACLKKMAILCCCLRIPVPGKVHFPQLFAIVAGDCWPMKLVWFGQSIWHLFHSQGWFPSRINLSPSFATSCPRRCWDLNILRPPRVPSVTFAHPRTASTVPMKSAAPVGSSFPSSRPALQWL